MADFPMAAAFVQLESSRGVRQVPPQKQLQLYALFKQAAAGPAPEGGDRADIRRAAWAALGELPRTEAAQRYVALVDSLFPGWKQAMTDAEAHDHDDDGGLGKTVSRMLAPDVVDDQSLFAAAQLGQLDRLASGLAANPSLLSARDDDGMTLMHVACDRAQLAVVEHLIAEALRLQILDDLLQHRDVDGLAPLHYAVVSSSKEVVQCLLRHGAVDLPDQDGTLASQMAEDDSIRSLF